MVDAESILDPIPSKQKRWIPKLGDINEANRFESCPDYKKQNKRYEKDILVFLVVIQLS